MSSPPNASEQNISQKRIEFTKIESFEVETNNIKYKLKISNNERLIYFEIEEINKFPKQDFNIYLSLEELTKINKFFLQFDNLNEVLESLKQIIEKKYLKIENEKTNIKMKIINPLNNKEFFINIPLKEKDIKAEINSIIPYITHLNEKIEKLEKRVNDLEKKVIDNEKIINEIIKNKEKKDLFKNSNIINPDEEELILSWFENKPKKFNLLLDSKIDGDSIFTFNNKCYKKSQTIVFIKTTNGYRFGGYTSQFWPNLDNYGSDDKSFLFSLDLKNKYKVINKNNAIYYCQYFFSFGDNLLIYDKCTTNSKNYINGPSSYDIPKDFEMTGGKNNFIVSNYEIYNVEF